MADVFIVRPFGNRLVLKKIKNSADTEVVNFDFDKVEKELIKPAMAACGLSGGTTGEVFAAGNIMEDMFSELLLADIVIADITIHNANVFYELGIRHSLRDKRTILIKGSGFDETPFDIIGYRYTAYSKDSPAEALAALITSMKETIDGDRKDSPVFNILPLLKSQDPERFLAIPEDFVKEVRMATDSKFEGRLALLAYETEGFSWKFPALRYIGETLYKLKAFSSAKSIWEKIEQNKPGDSDANDRLATIYQRLADLELATNTGGADALLFKSDLAIETLLKDPNLNDTKKAETFALKARNSKTRWINSWKDLEGDQLIKVAMSSSHLTEAFKFYEKGFYQNLDHFYSGLNALALLLILLDLIQRKPDAWELQFDTSLEAQQKRLEYTDKTQKLTPAVKFSIDAAKVRQESLDKTDIWIDISAADLMCLTSENSARVASMYTWLLPNADNQSIDSLVRQLRLFEKLGFKTANVDASLAVFPPVDVSQKTYYLLFTGHMIDKPDRAEPRFPASKELAVRQKIKEQIEAEKARLGPDRPLMAITGGACGGDILFLEVCAELGIKSQMFLALPREDFLQASVDFAGIGWRDRFDKLYQTLPHPILSESSDLPKWLSKKPNYDIWSRNNLWLLNNALVNGGINTTLIAVWDGKGGDGPGGTEHMVSEAKKRGARVLEIDIKNITV